MSGAIQRIGIVASPSLGGSGIVAAELAMGLAERGREVHFITTEKPFRLADHSGVHVHRIAPTPHPMWPSPPWGLALANGIAQVSRAHQLEVLHAHFAIPYGSAAGLACRMLGSAAPLWIATLHGTDATALAQDPAYRLLVEDVIVNANAVTAPSRHLGALVENIVPGPQIEVVNNFVDVDRFVPSARRDDPSSEAVLVHASNFREVKRVHDVVTAFARITEHVPARLLLIGDGPQRHEAIEQLTELGLRERIEAPGEQRDVEGWIARAHLALSPSAEESFGLAALEALACGVPVIGTRVGGLPEVVEHGGTGMLLPVGDVEGMAQAALALLRDPERWRAMALAARDRATKLFSLPRALVAYESLYRSAAERGTTSSARARSHTHSPFHDA